ncbi:MAG: twin-arginine translocation signal domain-containing protein [Desulfobacterales bacterium]|nr:twin-arginine translocation signal domain-containing protein [Desulfobacterales bacterium]
MDMEKDWIANAYEGMSRRQFLARMAAAGAAIAGFAVASKAVAGEIITTPADGLAVADGKVGVGGFRAADLRGAPGRSRANTRW